jgi:hypothetical protein
MTSALIFVAAWFALNAAIFVILLLRPDRPRAQPFVLTADEANRFSPDVVSLGTAVTKSKPRPVVVD